MVGHVQVVEALMCVAFGEAPGLGFQGLPRVGGCVVRVATDIPGGEDVVPGPVGIVVAEPAAPVVAMAAVLSLAALGLELAGVRAKAEVAAVDRRALAGFPRAHHAAAVAVGAIDPAVQAQLESIEPMLLVAFDEAGEEHFAVVGPAVAVAVLGVEDVGGARNQNTAPPRDEPGRESQAVQERRLLVIA